MVWQTGMSAPPESGLGSSRLGSPTAGDRPWWHDLAQAVAKSLQHGLHRLVAGQVDDLAGIVAFGE
jgi:hypothetical protein